MNRHGETWEKKPPAGEYWVCPLFAQAKGAKCEYKLLLQVSLWGPDGILTEYATPPAPLHGIEVVTEAIRLKLEAHMRERDQRMMDHLKTHELVDFYRTRAEIIGDAHKRADEITSLADKVFLSTATRERPEAGDDRR